MAEGNLQANQLKAAARVFKLRYEKRKGSPDDYQRGKGDGYKEAARYLQEMAGETVG